MPSFSPKSSGLLVIKAETRFGVFFFLFLKITTAKVPDSFSERIILIRRTVVFASGPLRKG